MSEKVLGFKQKDAEFFPYEKTTKIFIEKSKLVPVRLSSESVDKKDAIGLCVALEKIILSKKFPQKREDLLMQIMSAFSGIFWNKEPEVAWHILEGQKPTGEKRTVLGEAENIPVVSKHRFEREMERKNKRIKHLQKLLKAKKEARK